MILAVPKLQYADAEPERDVPAIDWRCVVRSPIASFRRFRSSRYLILAAASGIVYGRGDAYLRLFKIFIQQRLNRIKIIATECSETDVLEMFSEAVANVMNQKPTVRSTMIIDKCRRGD